MYCRNDFRKFLGEIITVKHDQVTLRDVNKVMDNLTSEFLTLQAEA